MELSPLWRVRNATHGGGDTWRGDGGPATEAYLLGCTDVALGPDGSIYIPDAGNRRVRRVSPSGIITTVAGTGVAGFSGDGGRATDAQLQMPYAIAVGPDGTLYINDQSRIRRVGTDGIITTVAGGGSDSGLCEGYPATAVSSCKYVAVAPDGSLLTSRLNTIARISPVLPGLGDKISAIPSKDGRLLYHFTQQGRHLRTLNALTGALLYEFLYDGAGRLTRVQGADGDITTIERSVDGKPTAIVAPLGQRTVLSLDANGYLAGVTNPSNETVGFGYSDSGMLTSITSPKGATYNYTYQGDGLLVRAGDPAGGFNQLSRAESADGYEVSLTTAKGRVSRYSVERLPTGAQRRVSISPDGTQSETLIGTDGRYTFTRPTGTSATMVLGPDPRFGMQAPLPITRTITTPGGLSSSITTTRTVALADANDLLSITFLSDTVAINGRSYVSTYSSATRTSTDTTPTGRETVTTIDLSGRVTQRQFLGLLPTGFGYDSRGFLTSLTRASGAEARTTSFGYTDDGRLATIMDPVGRSISFSYDAAGQLTQTTLPGSRVITYGYDQDGDLTSLKPPGQPAHTYAYTPVYLEAEYTPPDAGAGANSTQYAYDADRKITRLSLPGGGRPLTVTVPGGQITYAYDSQTGNLTMVTAPDGGTISYGYDGTLPTATTWAGTVSGSVNRAYDTSFRLSSFRVNGGHGIALQYDSDGLATGAGDLALSRAPQSGLITGTTLGGVADSRTYSGLGELVSYEASFNSTSIYRVEYTRDKLGRIAEERETTGGVTETWTYAYDLSGALAEVRKNGAPVVTYTYDANGNRLTCTGPGGTITGDYDDQDRLTQYGSTSYSYTDNGELLSKTANGWTTTYQYDALGSLRAVVPASGSRIDYVIDGTNRRIGKRADGVLTQSFLYLDGLRPVAELDGDDIVVSLFVYACQAHVPDYVIKAGTVYPIISDHLGSPRLVVNTQTGEIVQRLDSDAFGDVVLDTNPRFQPFGFAGGLVRSGLRDYDAKTGRWTAKDPLGFDGDSTNQYRYVLNDPVNAIDPCGVVETNPEAIRETLWALAHEEQRIGGWANMKAAYAEVDITEHALFGDSAMRYYGKPWPWDPKPYERVMAAGGRFLPFRDLNINSWKTQALGLRTELDLRWFVHGYLSGVPMYCIKVGVGVAYNVKTGRGLWSEGAETNLKSLALGQVVRWWGMDLTDFAQMVSGGPPANPRDYTKGSMFPPD